MEIIGVKQDMGATGKLNARRARGGAKAQTENLKEKEKVLLYGNTPHVTEV